MNNQYSGIFDDELVNDVENIMRNGSIMEKLETLEFVSNCFNKDVKMTKILIDATKASEDPLISDKAKELFVKNMDKFISKFISEQYPTFIGSHYEDMIQAARMGIIIGLDKYNPEIAKPTTFFVLYIKHEVSQYINNYVNGLSTYYANEKYKINKAINQLENENRETSDVNIAEITGITAENVKQIRNMIASTSNVAFDEVFMNKADENDTPEQIVLKKELGETINNTIERYLTDTEKRIITMYYGLAGNKGVSERTAGFPTKKAFRNISESLGIPYDKVRKYHASALRKLHTVVSKTNIVSELSKSEQILNTEYIPILSPEEGNLILNAQTLTGSQPDL
ncbi:sigma-70 family RNA polymerase sigma factor [Anaerocolumna sp. AGMB13025]|uniref:sigma-70 family RNA polymerase sigma factor n=1 Tax=Anaerocolumna sp. AGMB13025 TaxID=3039116 RepID=UPI00241D1B5E|nr:sigma-70 family RNA polymerase sigma factor [Anaerocolumna sp. AGMB13025]WFR59056.1 sigma-70 family RNA polymerase sigma factor [Anaerocolumna sp. AGMB13025]